MKKFTKFSSGLLASLVLLASCEQSNTGVTPVADGTISFYSSINEAASRATDAGFEAGDEISVSAYSGESLYSSNVLYGYSDGLFTSSDAIEMPTDGSELSFWAVYPFGEVTDGELSFSVLADQSSADSYTKSDLMSSYVSATTENSPTLVFNHLLTNIVLNVSSANLDLSSLEASLSALTVADVNIFTSSITASGDKSVIAPVTNGTNSYKAIIVPQSYSTGELMGQVVIEGTVVEFYSPSNITLASGCQYSLNVVVDQLPGGAITVTFADPIINDWNEGTIEGEIGGDDPVEEWVTISTNAVWYDDVCMSPFSSSTPVAMTGVTVQESTTTPGLFRLVDLYVNDDFTQHVFDVSAAELLEYDNLLEGYSIEINATNPDKVYIPLQNTGFMASSTYGYHYIATLNTESAGLDWSTSYSYYGTYDAEAGTISFPDAEGMYTILSGYATDGGWRTNDDGLTMLYFDGDDYVEPSDVPDDIPTTYTVTSITSSVGYYWGDWYELGMAYWTLTLNDTAGAKFELEFLTTNTDYVSGISTQTYPFIADGYYSSTGCLCDITGTSGVTIDNYKQSFIEDDSSLWVNYYGGNDYAFNFNLKTEYGTAISGYVIVESLGMNKAAAPAAVISPNTMETKLHLNTAEFYSFEY